MTKTAHALLTDALQLDVKTRADLVAELLASLDGPADADAEQAWAAEIERRVAGLEAGTEPVESWDDTTRRIERDILGR
jgi:putative addiction module component (TIGR02574 family)